MTALRTYYRGHRLVAMRDEVAQQTRYYHFDNQGTVQALTDSTGAVTDRFACDAWGVQVKRTGSSINRQWYVGHLGYYRQVDQLLDYVRARSYAMPRGRWTSTDPLPTQGGRYAYAAGTPAARMDPLGLVDCADAECKAEGFLRTDCHRPCNIDEKGQVVYPPPYPKASDVASQLERIYKICDGDYNWRNDVPWGRGQARTVCCNEYWCRRKCQPDEDDLTFGEHAPLRLCWHVRGCIEIARAPGKPTGWDWLPTVWQYCLWQHEARRAKLCWCTHGETNGGGFVPPTETDRLLDCVGRVLMRYKKDVRTCKARRPLVPFDPKRPDCLKTW